MKIRLNYIQNLDSIYKNKLILCSKGLINENVDKDKGIGRLNYIVNCDNQNLYI